MSSARQALLQIQLARFPRVGAVKTRLQPVLTPEQACDVHLALMQHTAEVLLASDLCAVELWLDSDDNHSFVQALLESGVSDRRLQVEGDLGVRMYVALNDGLLRAEKVLLVGSDCPALTPDYLSAAFAALDSTDVVLGPAEDGGFVLIACRRTRQGMFDNVPWGTSSVLEVTLESIAAEGLQTRLLEPLFDVDTPADLQRWRKAMADSVGA